MGISDLPYDEHRLIVVVAAGLLVAALVLPRRRAREQPDLLRAVSSAALGLVLAFVAAMIVTAIAWAGEPRLEMLPLAGAIGTLGWGTGRLLRRRSRRRALAPLAVLPLLVAAGLLWVRDAPPALSETAATRAFASQAGVRDVRCHRFASGDDSDLFGLSPAQFACGSTRSAASCARHRDCGTSFVSFDRSGRIRTRESPGGP